MDLLWEFPAEWRIATLSAAAAGGATLLIALAALTLRAAHDAAVAQRLDRAGNCGGRVLTGWELALGRYGLSGMQPAPLSAGLADLAVDEAAVVARTVPSGRAAPCGRSATALATLAVLWAVAGILAVGLPGLAWTQWSRFLRPFDDIPPFSLSTFDVTPGDVQVLYGSELEDSRRRTRRAGGSTGVGPRIGPRPGAAVADVPRSGRHWRAVLAKVVEPADYCVRAYRAKSEIPY